MDLTSPPAASESDYWWLVFHEKSSLPWLWWLGRFKHVSAFTYVGGFRMWEVYDVQNHRTRILRFAYDEWVRRGYPEWTRDAVVVKFHVKPAERTRIASRFFFFCGPAIKHLVGLRCLALRPDAIYRQVIRAGGQPIVNQDAADSGRSESGAREGAG